MLGWLNKIVLTVAFGSSILQAQTGVPASSVIYAFTGTTDTGLVEQFSYTSPTFITGTTTIPPSALTSCSPADKCSGGITIDPTFTQNINGPVTYATVFFGVNQSAYYFPFGAFGHAGTFTNANPGFPQTGTLMVEQETTTANTSIHTWGGSSTDIGNAVATDSAGNIYIAGSTTSFGAGGQDVLLLKYDSSGNLIWAKTWGGPNNDSGNAVLVGNDGSVYVVGQTQSYGAGWYDVLVLKFDSFGTLQWSRTWGGGSFDVGYDLSFDQSGNLAIVAESYSFGNSIVLLTLSSDGNLISATAWKGSATYDSGYSITVDSDGNEIITGTSWDYSVNPNHNRIPILKFDHTGALLWSRMWVGPSEDEAFGRKAVRTDAEGNIYVLGHTSPSCTTSDFSQCVFDMLLLKISPAGDLLWAQKWGGGGYVAPGGLWIDGNGEIATAGSVTTSVGGLQSALAQRYDLNGNLLTSQKLSSNAASGLNSLTANESRTFFATGFGLNAAGNWMDTDRSSNTALGSLSNPPATLTNPVGSIGIPRGMLGIPIGTIDLGGGGQDQLLVALGTGNADPAISGINPSFGMQGQTLPNFVVNGINFDSNSSLSFSNPGIAVNSYVMRTTSQIVADISIAPAAPPAFVDVTVTTSNQKQATLTGAFTINLAPPVPSPVIKIGPTSLDFGTIDPNTSATQPIVIQNVGNAPLTITNFGTTNASFYISPSGVCLACAIQPGQSITANAVFSPMQVGSVNALLTITSNASVPSMAIPVSGIASTAPLGKILLVYSNDSATNHPLYITTQNQSSKGNIATTDVTVTNVTGTWYELDLSSNSPTANAPYPIPVQGIPFAFYIAPYQQLTFHKLSFAPGQYLQFNATDTSLPATAIFELDFVTRAFLGVKLNLSALGILNLSDSTIGAFLSAVQKDCVGPALAIGTATSDWDIFGKAADLAQCIATNQEVMQATSNLIELLYGAGIATSWQSITAMAGSEISGFLFLFNNVSEVVALAEEELTANHAGYVRIEAQRH